MPTINIKVKDKIAKQVGNERYICGNSDFTVEFEFDSEWDAYPTKTARFRYDGVYQEKVFTGNICPVPVIFNAGAIAIGVYAGDLRTTTAAIVEARHSILDGDHVQYVPPDLYEELTGQLEDLRKQVEDFSGTPGPPGPPGPSGIYVGSTEPTDDNVLVWITVDEGDVPDVPDDPTATKLTAPTIRLVTDGEDSGGDVPDAGTLTPAILGVAILGRTILGMTDVGGKKLAAPVIELTTSEVLAAPEIELVEV